MHAELTTPDLQKSREIEPPIRWHAATLWNYKLKIETNAFPAGMSVDDQEAWGDWMEKGVTAVVAQAIEPDPGSAADLCRLPVRLFPSKMNIISTSHGLETIKDLCIVKETKKVFEIRLQKLPSGEFPEIQLFVVQNRHNFDPSSP